MPIAQDVFMMDMMDEYLITSSRNIVLPELCILSHY